MIDKKDHLILKQLQENSRQSWKEIGDKIYLSGQAVGNRVAQLLDKKIIKKFTIEQHYDAHQFITIFMDTNTFTEFEQWLYQQDAIISIYKISGEGCYLLETHLIPIALEAFLAEVTKYGRYKVNNSLKKLK